MTAWEGTAPPDAKNPCFRWYAQMRLARFVAKRHGRRPAFGRWVVGVVSANQLGLVSL